MTASRTLLATDGLTARFGGHVAVDAVTCAFRAGELTAIVGPNGAGKTTYFNLISGQVRATEGRVTLSGRDISWLRAPARARAGLGRAFQQTSLFPGLSVLENVRLALRARHGKGFRMLRRASADREIEDEAERILMEVRLLGQAEALAAALSHGDQRKLEVALLIALDPLVYLFDEPTAGMSAEDVPHLLEMIARLGARSDRAVLLVEHKMDVIRRLARRIIVLHNGELIADGAPSEVMSAAVVQEAYLGRVLEHV